jgi:hypothetical protein
MLATSWFPKREQSFQRAFWEDRTRQTLSSFMLFVLETIKLFKGLKNEDGRRGRKERGSRVADLYTLAGETIARSGAAEHRTSVSITNFGRGRKDGVPCMFGVRFEKKERRRHTSAMVRFVLAEGNRQCGRRAGRLSLKYADKRQRVRMPDREE